MKKNERLIAELFFINQKKQFNLVDLMNQFSISKRTALRDITDLELLGAPIYVDKGRYGGYTILKNNSLPPLYLNQNEWYSMFFALQLFKSLGESPFTHSYTNLKNKFLAISPEKELDFHNSLDRHILFSGFKVSPTSPLLAELFQLTYKPQVLTIMYNRYTEDIRLIQPIQLILDSGYWYLRAWDFDQNSFRQFRCDFIASINLSKSSPLPYTLNQFLTLYQEQMNHNRTLTFKAELNQESLELFKKRQYDAVKLIKENETYFVIGQFNESETPFLMDYFLSFGHSLTLISPSFLVDSFKNHLKNIQDRYA